MPDRVSRYRAWARFALFVAITGGLIMATILWGLPDSEQLREETARLGPWAPALSLLFFAAIALGPVPKSVLCTAAGLLFGMKVGLVIALVGGLVSAMLAFGLGRILVRDLIERLGGRRLARFDSVVENHGFVAVIAVRLSPVVPFALFNYAAGSTAIGVRTFFIGTAVGIIPGSVAYVALGTYGRSPTSWPPAAVLLPLGIILLLAFYGTSVAKYRKRLS